MKRLTKKIFRSLGLEITRYNPDDHAKEFISLKSENRPKGNVLLSYTINPFLVKDGKSFDHRHNCDWECFQIAKTFLDLGYHVDVIPFTNDEFVPGKDYAFFIDVLSNMQRIAPMLNSNCKKIFYTVFAHWLFNNSAEYQRYLSLQQRKGKILNPRIILQSNLGIEYADYCILRGNEFTISTYRYAQKPIFQIPISTTVDPIAIEDKNYEACRNSFVWFGGWGLVHKGLDLVLEAFAEMPECHLSVCGPIQREDDFEQAYYRELYQTLNIHTIGWVDVKGPQFAGVMNNCIGLIFPSCAEGQSGSVVNCLHAGLIPVISYESGVDVHEDFGIIMESCSIDAIKSSVKRISSLPAGELKKMSSKAQQFAKDNFTRETFTEGFKKALSEIMDRERNEKLH